MDSSSEKVTMIFSPAVYNPTPYNHRFKKSLASGRNRKKKGKGKEREGNDDAGEDEDDEAMPTFRLETEGNLGSSEVSYFVFSFSPLFWPNVADLFFLTLVRYRSFEYLDGLSKW